MNKVFLNGRLTKDIDLTFAQGSGMAICKFNLAVNRKFKKDEADFFNCIAFNKTGEIIAEHFKKGSAILIEGHIQTGSYENKEGKRVYTTDIVVDTFDFIESKKEKSDIAPTQDWTPTNSDADEIPF